MQAAAWIVCTTAAFITARNRQIVRHRQWMARSNARRLGGDVPQADFSGVLSVRTFELADLKFHDDRSCNAFITK